MSIADVTREHRKFVVAPIDPSDLVARARALLDAPVTAATMPGFVRDVNEVSVDFSELEAGLTRAMDEDTADEAAKAAYLDFVTNHVPELTTLKTALERKQLAVVDYSPPADLAGHWADMRVNVELFREENLPLEAEIATLTQAHGEVSGSLRVELDGETLTLGQALAKLESPDRELRERAYHAIEAGREAIRPRLDEIFAKLMPLRKRIARGAGLADYREYAWLMAKRREYTPQDALTMHESVAKEVVPRLRSVYERRARLLGLERLRPWDLDCDVHGREALAPFTSVAELEEGLARMFSALDGELAQAYDLLRGGWMDLEPRPSKVPGLGYQNYFPRSQRPYVYWSAVGTDDDLLTMRHEAGHAFHSVLTQARWPLLAHRSERPEMCELASQAMELLTLPYLTRDKGGFYSQEDAARSQAALLVRALSLLVSASKVDAIQHFVYTHPSETGPTIAEIDAQWRRLDERFDTGMDMTGFDRLRSKGWHIIHLFHYPFYYLEYAMAYLGALQVWRNALQDAPRALGQYKAALALGGTRPLDELYEAAGIRFAFDERTVASLSQLAVDALGDEA
ncbi:MAG: M3 family oligoendopeptidase [Trueperaceae bacterium]|nr:M3 family oligoendopeptidase [Trueperaceae bacterium]MCC6310241.1 M3 family oligoendopeptidase [Trueperaceae bacterium]MCO5173241.1 M3 family oligoendopeptidase [Trueperaceae bacterium]MCW5818690.1 M3 family oligoendopeptidase [Trueperaceae bacterium]